MGNEPSTIEIPIRLEGASNHLGGIYDLDYSGAVAKAKMIKITKASCTVIKATKALPETKLMVSTVSVTRKIRYKGALASFSLNDYKDIDTIFQRYLSYDYQKHGELSNCIALHTTSLSWARNTAVFCDSPADQIEDANGWPCGRGQTKGHSQKFACPRGQGERRGLLKRLEEPHRHIIRARTPVLDSESC